MNKLMKGSISSIMIASAFFVGLPTSDAASEDVELLHSSKHKVQTHSHSTLDLAIANDDQLIESFIKRGLLSKNATENERRAFLKNYLELKGKETGVKESDPLAAKVKASEAKKQQNFEEYKDSLLKGVGQKNGLVKGTPDPVKESSYTGEKREDNVLVLMVEYSDFEHNNIDPSETNNYYEDYSPAHYEDMIFGENGVKGPHGENFVSMKQFYEQQSGGTYSVKGKSYGWLKVPGTAAFYGGDREDGGHDNVNPGGSKQLVADAYKAALDAGVPVEDYDVEDPHDFDGDGNLLEKDGLVDHLMIIHSSVGQEAGGGSLGNDAIWSHRSARFVDLDGFDFTFQNPVGKPGFYDYTMMPEDGATGVFAHEYGHDLGLPDEYDTVYSGGGEAIAYWSIMASGSWAGDVPGAEPTGFSPYAKEYFQSYLGGNWTKDTAVVNLEDLSTRGTQFFLDQANSPNGANPGILRVNLPKKITSVNVPKTGSYEYWGGQADEMDTQMTVSIDLTGKQSAALTFDAWYDIEERWDFAFVQVSVDNGATWASLGNANTRSDVVPEGYPTILNSMPGFTGTTNGEWQVQSFDLSDYAGKPIKLRLRYATDWGTSNTGFFADNIKVTADGQTLIEDGAENAASSFTLNGFKRFEGTKVSDHYYLLEWRNHAGVDKGLAHIRRGNSLMSYDSGLVVWYVDETYTDNWTGVHPGDGFLGVIDAHPKTKLTWDIGGLASTRYHIADAAFGLNPTSGLAVDYGYMALNLKSQNNVSLFDDSNSFLNPYLPDAGRAIHNYGLKVRVNGQSADKSVGAIVIYK